MRAFFICPCVLIEALGYLRPIILREPKVARPLNIGVIILYVANARGGSLSVRPQDLGLVDMNFPPLVRPLIQELVLLAVTKILLLVVEVV